MEMNKLIGYKDERTKYDKTDFQFTVIIYLV